MIGGILITLKCETKKCEKNFFVEGNAAAKDTCCPHCKGKKYDFVDNVPARNMKFF